MSVTPGGAQTPADNKYLSEAGILAPLNGPRSQSLYGLGNYADQDVKVGGGLFPIQTDKDGNAKAEEIVKTFAKSSPAVKAQIQHLLMLGGFYSADADSPNYGLLGKEDLDAFAKATTLAGQQGLELSEYLAKQARFGQYSGAAAAAVASKPRVIQKADPLSLAAKIDKEYQALTGKKATPAERAGFIAAYNATFAALQKQNYDAQQAAVGTAPAVATDYSEVNQPVAPLQVKVHPGTVTSTRNSPMPVAPPVAAQTTVEQENFDPDAFAEQYVRENATAQTGAHDLSNTFQQFLSLIGVNR